MIKTLLCFFSIVIYSNLTHASDFFSENSIVSAFQVNTSSFNVFNLLSAYGFDEEDFVNIVKKYPELKDFNLSTTSNYLISQNDDESVLEIKFYTDNNQAYLITKTDIEVEIDKTEAHFEFLQKNIEGTVYHNLYDAVLDETSSMYLAKTLNDAFAGEFENSKGLKTRPVFNFQVEELYDHGHFIKYGKVLNATLQIRSAISKKEYSLNTKTNSGSLVSDNFDLVEKPFYLPVDSLRVTSLFQLNRHHPVTHKYQPHNGIDLGVPSGSPVYPALDGIVVTVSRTKSKGKYITIRHDNGFLTTYIHLKKFAKGLHAGNYVELGEKIGEVGRTGYSTGSHLHFGVIQDGFFINPIYLLKRYSYNQKDAYEGQELGIDNSNIDESNIAEDESEE